MEPLLSNRKPKHGLQLREKCAGVGSFGAGRSNHWCDDFVILAETLYTYTCTTRENSVPDKDMVVDAVLFLWQKCKMVLQRTQIGLTDPIKYLQKIDHFGKWIHILCLTEEVICWCNIGEIDPAVVAEVTLYLITLLENLVDSNLKPRKKSGFQVQDESQKPGIEQCFPSSIFKKKPVEKILVACKMAKKAIDSMDAARLIVASSNASSMVDSSRLKCISMGEKQLFHPMHCETQMKTTDKESSNKSASIHSFTMDLHLELIQAYHRLALKFIKLSPVPQNPEPSVPKCKPSWARSTSNAADGEKPFMFSREEDIIANIKNNKISKALFLMQKALSLPNKGQISNTQKQLLEEVVSVLRKVEAEDKKLYHLNRDQKSHPTENEGVVPAPILLYRAHNSMIFTPAPFNSSEKVYWYQIFGRIATGYNPKVRMNDCHFLGTGQEVPASGKCFLKVGGLEPNEKYIFAVVAYSETGKIIGNTIGETTKPILACHPLPILTTWAYLCQYSYQLGHYPVAKLAFSVLWDHFVIAATNQDFAISLTEDWKIVPKSLCCTALQRASPILLRLFLGNIFISCDISVKEEEIFCDALCSNGPLLKGQLWRLAECEKMLVAIELAGWVNDNNQALQAVVQCYGLLAPVIWHMIPLVPVVQILIKCLSVLQEVLTTCKLKKQRAMINSLQHMIACMTCHLAKVLRSWNEFDLAFAVINIGKKLLKSKVSDDESKAEEDPESVPQDGWEKRAKQESVLLEKTLNEQVETVEAGLLQMSKEVVTKLTGNEDPSLLFGVILFSPIDSAYEEVIKFKDSNRFLEFFNILIEKAIHLDQLSMVLEWVNLAESGLKHRKESTCNLKKNLKRMHTPSQPETGKIAAAVVEYQHKPEYPSDSKKVKKAVAKLKDAKELYENKLNIQSEAKTRSLKDIEDLRKSREKMEKKATQALEVILGPILREHAKRRKVRQKFADEMPFRSHMNLLFGFTYFSLFIKSIEHHYKQGDQITTVINRYSFLDPAIFSLFNCGTVLLKDEEDKSTQVTIHESLKLPPIRRKFSATWSRISDDSESNDNSECTDASEEDQAEEMLSEHEDELATMAEIQDQLGKSFFYFKRAVVLAHRCYLWTALQNVCRGMWNCAHVAVMYVTGMEALPEPYPVTIKQVRSIFSLPFYLASENLLDMVVHMQKIYSNVKFVDPDGIFVAPGFVEGISADKGGFSLRFEKEFDDINVMDLRLVCDMVLYTLELLYFDEQWERLTDLAMHFNALTHERFIEKVTPVLVYAQRQLMKRIREFNGPDPPQPHLLQTTKDSKDYINSRSFIASQMKIQMPIIEVVNQSSDLCFGVTRAKALVGVPLDVNDTLSCFKDSLNKAHFLSRILRHSRKLFTLYLAYTQQQKLTRPKAIGFKLGTAHIESCTPDFSNEEFLSFDSIQSKPVPESSLSLPISSYDKTIELLQAHRQNSLSAQALHELGNLHFCAGNKRSSFMCWCKAVDAALDMTNFLSNWRHLKKDKVNSGIESLKTSRDYSEIFLDQAGIWGCLLAGVLTAKIAQYFASSDLKFRQDCCLVSALLFKSLFRSTLPYPRADYEYASYEIGDGWPTHELIPGIDLFSDRFRIDVRSVVGSLRFVLYELHRTGQYLLALPLFTLYQYFVTTICHDKQRSFEGRILKIKVLTDLAFFAEAFKEFSVVVHGEKVPHRILGCFKYVESKNQMLFHNTKSLMAENNIMVLQELLNSSPPPDLCKLYGSRLMNKFKIAQTHFLIKIAETIHQLPTTISEESQSLPRQTIEEDRVIDLDVAMPHLIIEHTQPRNPIVPQYERKVQKNMKIDLLSYKMMTPSKLKGILLTEAEFQLNALVLAVKKEYKGTDFTKLPAVGLEIIIEAKLQYAAISLQRLHVAFSAAIALSAIELLNKSQIYTKDKLTRSVASSSKMSATKTSPSQPPEKNADSSPGQQCHNVEAHERIDIRLWLKCRLAFVTALTSHVYGVELNKEKDSILETSLLCAEGVEEAKACGDIEMQTEFILQTVLLYLQLGQLKSDIKILLQNAVDLLNGRQFNSHRAKIMLAQSLIQLADLKSLETDGKLSTTQNRIDLCISARNLLVQQLFLMGELVEQIPDDNCFTLVVPLKNIYFPQLSVLTKVKLRLGHALARKALHDSSKTNSSPWIPALSELKATLDIWEATATREFNLESDILFQKGKVEHQLLEITEDPKLEGAKSLLDGINVNLFNEHNLWLIKQSYLEIALIYLRVSAELDRETKTKPEAPVEKLTTSKTGSKRPKRKITGKGRLNEILLQILKHSPKYILPAWIALRAANQISEAITNRRLLPGNPSVDDQGLFQKTKQQIPQCAILDILASYEDFQTDINELLPTFTTIQGEMLTNVQGSEGENSEENAEGNFEENVEVDTGIVIEIEGMIENQEGQIGEQFEGQFEQEAKGQVGEMFEETFEGKMEGKTEEKDEGTAAGKAKGESEKKMEEEVEGNAEVKVEEKTERKTEENVEEGDEGKMKQDKYSIIFEKYQKEASQLTMIHLLRYKSHLYRLQNINLHSAGSEFKCLKEQLAKYSKQFNSTYNAAKPETETETDDESLSLHAVLDGLCTSVFDTGTSLRLLAMHEFLTQNVFVYRTTCCGETPPKPLSELFEKPLRTSRIIQEQYYTTVFGEYMIASPDESLTASKYTSTHIGKTVSAPTKELCIQWYLPTLDKPPQISEKQVLLIYAFNNKAVTVISLKTCRVPHVNAGQKWIPLHGLLLLHEKLSELRQQAEALLQVREKTSSESPVHFGSSEKRLGSATKTEALSEKSRKIQQLEDMTRLCCTQIKQLLLSKANIEPEPEIPFDVSIANLQTLEKIFDPSRGHILSPGLLLDWIISFIIFV